MVPDCLSDRCRIGFRVGIGIGIGIGLGPGPGHRRACEADPQLRSASAPLVVALALVLFADQLQPLVGERVELDVWPGGELLRRPQTERLSGQVGLLRHQDERFVQLIALQPAAERDGAQMMPVQPCREVLEHRVSRIGRDALDDELLSRHSNRERALLAQQRLDPADDALRGRLEGGVPARIHRVLVERDGELDEEVGEVARECCAL